MTKEKVTLRMEEGELALLKEKYNTDNQSEVIQDQRCAWNRKLIGDFVVGAWNGLKAMVMGPIEMLASNAQIDAILNDSFLLVENMAQEITDTAEEKGISYCIGYVAGPILVTKGADKAIVNKATANSATVFHTQQGSYVIVDDVTKRLFGIV